MGIPGKNWTELKHGFHHSNCISDSYKMNTASLTILACIFVSLFMGNIADDTGLAEAPTTSDNCLCQCASTIYLDQSRTLQGNCKSADPTERSWCYIRGDDTIEACGTPLGLTIATACLSHIEHVLHLNLIVRSVSIFCQMKQFPFRNEMF